MRDLINNGEDVKIVGIVQPKEDANASMLSAGINYPASMTDHVIEQAAQSEIVQDQLSDSSINVFTGEPFGEEDQGNSSFSMDSLFTIDGNAISAAFQIDESALIAGLGDMNLDLSNVSIDMSSLPAFDASSIEVDPGSIDMSSLENMSFDLGSIDLNQDVSVDSDILAEAMTDTVKGFWPWYAANVGNYEDFDSALNAYLSSAEVQETLNEKIATAVDVSGIEESIQEEVKQQTEAQLGSNIALQIQSQISSALQSAVQTQLQNAIQQYMTQAISTTMSQFGTALEQQLGGAMQIQMAQLATNMASAMQVDPNAMAQAFQVNMDEESLGELMMSMMTGGETTYDSNLRELGYADKSEPAGIDIYPLDFDSKEHVIEILDNYNTQMEDNGEEDKVITYTDLVGTLMSSVTTIVDMISYVLIASQRNWHFTCYWGEQEGYFSRI